MLKIFLDNIGRTVLGDVTEADGLKLKVKNPAILSYELSNNQVRVNMYPFIVPEFLKTQTDCEWDVTAAGVVNTEIDLDPRIISQYNNIFNKQVLVEPITSEKVINLFE